MSLAKKQLKDVDVAGKRVLIRVDFNVPQVRGSLCNQCPAGTEFGTSHHPHHHGATISAFLLTFVLALWMMHVLIAG